MPWGRLDDQLHQNEKVLSLSDKAFRVWLYSISYCNAKRSRDPVGTLGRGAVQALCRLVGAGPAVVAELIAKRGWDAAPDGVVVHDFPDYGPPKDPTAAERMARWREKQRLAQEADPVTVTRNEHRSDRNGNASPVPGPVPVPHDEEATSQQQTRMAISRSPDASVDDFDAWWLTYPRHVAKQPARSAYRKRRTAGRSAEALLDAALNYAEHVAAAGTPADKIAHGATFLNQHRDEEWEHGPPDRDRATVPSRSGQPKLADTAAGLRWLKEQMERHGDDRTSFWSLATAGVGLPDPGGPAAHPGALPRPPEGPPLA